MIQVIENILSIAISKHHDRREAQDKPQQPQMDSLAGALSCPDDEPDEKPSRDYPHNRVQPVKQRQELKVSRREEFAAQFRQHSRVFQKGARAEGLSGWLP